MAQLYADEDFPFPVVLHLRQLGHDVVTALEAARANQAISDEDQLLFATGQGRAVLTRNRKDYIRLHRRFAQHSGIISVTDDPDFNGQAVRIDVAISALFSLLNQHVRVNRPAKP